MGHLFGLRHRILVALAGVFVLSAFVNVSAEAQQPDDFAVKMRFSIDEHGDFLGQILHTMGQEEVGYLIAAGCAAYGIDCTKQAAQLVALAQQLDPNMRSAGTAHSGIYRAPVGYTICRARIDYAHAGIDEGSLMSAQLMRTAQDNGLGWYSEVPKGTDGRGHGFDADLYVRYVLASPGNVERHSCWQAGLLWKCKGHDSCEYLDPKARY